GAAHFLACCTVPSRWRRVSDTGLQRVLLRWSYVGELYAPTDSFTLRSCTANRSRACSFCWRRVFFTLRTRKAARTGLQRVPNVFST
ncbi:Sucrose synthase 3, partial [Frankliniella fusca]